MKRKSMAKRMLACLLFVLLMVQPLGALAAGTESETSPPAQSDISVTTSMEDTADPGTSDATALGEEDTEDAELENQTPPSDQQQPEESQEETGDPVSDSTLNEANAQDESQPEQAPDFDDGASAPVPEPDETEDVTEPAPEEPADTQEETEAKEVVSISEDILSKQVVYVPRGTSIQEMTQQLPTEGECTFSDGTSAVIPITWACAADDEAEYTADASAIPWLIFWPEPAGDDYLADTVEGYDLPYAVVAFTDDMYNQISLMAYGSTSFTTTSPYTNYITDTRGWGLSTKRHHTCNTDGTMAYCLTQGAADPDGRSFHFAGYVDNATAVILDHGYPNTTVIDGVALSASQAAQATQAAIWAVSQYNFKHPVTIDVLRSTGRDNGSTLSAARHLVSLAQNGTTSSSQYAVYEPDGGRGSGYQYMVSTKSESGTLRVQKSSAVPSLTNGNGNYSLAGAVFGVYADAACSAEGWRRTIYTDASGSTETITLTPGTYYIREQHAPANYVRDSVVHRVTVSAGAQTVVPISNYPVRGVIQIRKSSTNPGLTNGNGNYSLAGAVFGVYNSSGQEIQRLTTDANGAVDSGQLPVGTYTVKEISPSKGYELNTTTFTARISPIVANQTQNNGGVYLAAQYDKNGTLYFEVRNAGAYAGTGLRAAVWTEANGQDDLRWFDLTLLADRTTFSGIEYMDGHPGTGIISIHVYPMSGPILVGGAFNFISYDNWVQVPISVPEPPKPMQGYIEIQKSSSRTDLTNGNSAYSLTGATYGIYTDPGCSNRVAILTTDTNGYAKSGALNQGTYYVKEMSAPQGFLVDTSAYTVTVTPNQTYHLAVSDIPVQLSFDIVKSSGDTVITDNSNGYALNGAEYQIYRGSSWDSKTLVNSGFTDGSGRTTSPELPLLPNGSYYFMQETKSSAGYLLDSTIYRYSVTFTPGGFNYQIWASTDQGASWQQTQGATFASSGSALRVNSTEMPKKFHFSITKVSENPSITDGNSCYSLQDAVYTLYYDRIDDAHVAARYTTDANGQFTASNIPIRSNSYYYLKETQPSQGYLLDDTIWRIQTADITGGNDFQYRVEKSENGGVTWTDVWSTTVVTAETSFSITSEEPPAHDPLGITLTKIQQEPNQYLPSLAGAQFTINFYAGQYSSVDQLPAEATRTWVVETIGRKVSTGTVYQTGLLDECKVDGDGFYYGGTGGPVLPLGTITIQETSPAWGYTTEGGYFSYGSGQSIADENGIVILNVTQDEIGGTGFLQGGNAYTKEESFRDCSITLHKRDDAGQIMSGAKFRLEILNPETGEYDPLKTGATDSNGQLVFDRLVYGTYRITETASAGSGSLLAEPIEITLPVTDVADAGTSTPTYTEDGTSYFCDITFTVQNGIIVMPRAGGIGVIPVICTGIICVCLAAGFYLTTRRRRKT